MAEPLKFLPASEWKTPNYATWRNARRTIEGEPLGGGSFKYANADVIEYRGICECCKREGVAERMYPTTDGWKYRFLWGWVCPECALTITETDYRED